MISLHGAPGPIGVCVLASGSAGNCAVVVSPRSPEPGSPARVALFDAGLSPRRTAAMFAQIGLCAHDVDDIVFTHLDTDHAHPGWGVALRRRPWRASLRIHTRHLGRGERLGLLEARTIPFEDEIDLGERVRAHAHLGHHDELGVAAFRVEARDEAGRSASLGYATDVGRVTKGLIAHLEGVGVLAIESNYCPQLQLASDRPAFLKRRIMGGSGHLSNQESADAVRRIRPREHTVLLHLSRQCNTPERAHEAHADGPAPVTLSNQHRATGWVWSCGVGIDDRATLFDATANGLFGA